MKGNILFIVQCDSKSQCSHMWVHWPKCLKILFLSKRYLISFLISYRLFVVFNNANAVSAEMWVWGFGNHAWNKSLLSSHSSATRDLTRLLYHLWFPKPHTHISYSQYFHIARFDRMMVPQKESRCPRLRLVTQTCQSVGANFCLCNALLTIKMS